jgi:hypothetical protein
MTPEMDLILLLPRHFHLARELAQDDGGWLLTSFAMEKTNGLDKSRSKLRLLYL